MLRTSGFADDVMFSLTKQNQSEDAMFGQVRQVALRHQSAAEGVCKYGGKVRGSLGQKSPRGPGAEPWWGTGDFFCQMADIFVKCALK